jgi:hypothetical protein
MKTIDTVCGIYNTEYTLINHKDGSISVKTPFIKWTNNSGTLVFKKIKITKFIEQAKDCFNDDDGEMSISEILYINDR